MEKDMIVKKNENIVARTIHNCIFLIDIAENYSDDKCHLYEINEIGKFIWDKIDNCRTRYDLAVEVKNAVVDDVSLEEIIEDTNCFISQLIHDGFVVEE